MKVERHVLLRAFLAVTVLVVSYLSWRNSLRISSAMWVPGLAVSVVSLPLYMWLVNRAVSDGWPSRMLAYLLFAAVLQVALWQTFRHTLSVQEWTLLLMLLLMNSLTGPGKKFTDLPAQVRMVGRILVCVVLALTVWLAISAVGRPEVPSWRVMSHS